MCMCVCGQADAYRKGLIPRILPATEKPLSNTVY